MKISSNLLIAKANLNGSKKKNTIQFMMILSVVSIIVLVGFLNIVNTKINFYKDKDILKQIYIMPTSSISSLRGVTKNNINEILCIEHIVSCKKQPYANYQLISINEIFDENNKKITNTTEDLNIENYIFGFSMQEVDSNYSSEIIDGKSLDESPSMSCIVPHYIVDEENNTIDTSKLLGKTLSIKNNYLIHLYSKDENGKYTGEWAEIAEMSYNLTVVGVYYYSNERSISGATSVLISPETATQLESQALEKAQLNKNTYSIDDYINDPYARDYVVTVDEYKNVQFVQEKLAKLNFNAGVRVGYMNESVEKFSEIFSGAGTFLAISILLLTIINILISIHSNILDRKSEIGLMKALGYKTHQIFYCMYMESVILSVRATLIGGFISAVLVGTINIINSHQDIVQRIYVMPLGNFIIFILIAFTVVLIIPLICQLIMVNLISIIQPQEAMNA
ncbi:MAG: ABC transporter permease [Acutalibacteraceae bacterium]|nr:ABC transporter permease [Acutalibacteraceae bacterium]